MNMNTTALRWMGRSLAVVAAASLWTACADEGALGPDARATRFTAAPDLASGSAAAISANAGNAPRLAIQGACANLNVPDGNKLVFQTYATGVQIYRWNGTDWSFVAPDALLFADASGNGMVGSHYAGPTWESAAGSKVVGAVRERCTPDPDAVAWLLLAAVSTEGPGIFHRVTFIQRVNTVGGNAPSHPGSFTGEEARMPYTTEYLFYQAQ